jgi:hypothetical protein
VVLDYSHPGNLRRLDGSQPPTAWCRGRAAAMTIANTQTRTIHPVSAFNREGELHDNKRDWQ